MPKNILRYVYGKKIHKIQCPDSNCHDSLLICHKNSMWTLINVTYAYFLTYVMYKQVWCNLRNWNTVSYIWKYKLSFLIEKTKQPNMENDFCDITLPVETKEKSDHLGWHTLKQTSVNEWTELRYPRSIKLSWLTWAQIANGTQDFSELHVLMQRLHRDWQNYRHDTLKRSYNIIQQIKHGYSSSFPQ